MKSVCWFCYVRPKSGYERSESYQFRFLSIIPFSCLICLYVLSYCRSHLCPLTYILYRATENKQVDMMVPKIRNICVQGPCINWSSKSGFVNESIPTFSYRCYNLCLGPPNSKCNKPWAYHQSSRCSSSICFLPHKACMRRPVRLPPTIIMTAV